MLDIQGVSMASMAGLLRAGEENQNDCALGNKPTPWTRLLICKELETGPSTGDGREVEFSPGNKHDFSE